MNRIVKIIGTTQEGYILSASLEEIANLLGFYSAYDDKAKVRDLKSGTEIKISGLYQHLYALSSMKKKLGEAQSALRECADRITPVVPVVPEIVLPG